MQTNYLLSAIDSNSRHFLLNRSREISFEYGDSLYETLSPIDRALFPISGLISVVIELADSGRIGCAIVGCHGALGGAAAFGGQRHLGAAIGCNPGTCWAVPITDVMHIANQDSYFRTLLSRQEQFLLAQTQYMAACNASHTLQERLAGWLLRAREATGSDELLITQEQLAETLAVQRASVSMVAHSLGLAGTIEYRRGHIRVLSPEGLARAACECQKMLCDTRNRALQCTSICPTDLANDIPIQLSTTHPVSEAAVKSA